MEVEMIVRFVGLEGVPLGGRFIYPGETREVSERELVSAARAHPGWFEVDGSVFIPADEIASSQALTVAADEADATQSAVRNDGGEVVDVSSVEHVDQPVARRRGGSKRSAQ